VSLRDAAAHFDVSIKTIRRRIADGTVPAVRMGEYPNGMIRIPVSALESVFKRVA
jgi:hypothetical protein